MAKTEYTNGNLNAMVKFRLFVFETDIVGQCRAVVKNEVWNKVLDNLYYPLKLKVPIINI